MDRHKNEAADALLRLGSRREPVPPNVFLDELWTPSVKVMEEAAYTDDPDSELVAVTRIIPEWTEPYLAYLMKGELPKQEVIARQIERRAKVYSVINGNL